MIKQIELREVDLQALQQGVSFFCFNQSICRAELVTFLKYLFFFRKCWLESSFVGNRPLDSPQTPVIDTFSPRGSADATMSRLNGVGKSVLV